MIFLDPVTNTHTEKGVIIEKTPVTAESVRMKRIDAGNISEEKTSSC